jgi:hypothetical protein
VRSRGFRASPDAYSTLMVNVWFPARSIHGFEMVAGRRAELLGAQARINRIFTPNRIIAIFSKFSAILPQWKHLRFIEGC